MKRRLLALAAILFIAIGSGVYGVREQRNARAASTDSVPSREVAVQTAKPNKPGFDTTQHSIDMPDSIWVIVNKSRPLQPKTYVPTLVVPDMTLRSNITADERQVRPDTAAALQQMSAAAKADGVSLTLESGYRSYNFQANLYNHYVKVQGQTVADTQSARPGYSEHQTGLSADIGGTTKPGCNVEACFANTPEGIWLASHAYQYGFIIRYPDDKTNVTGYTYEPWHIRYVGVSLAKQMHTQNVETLEEFFATGNAPDYR